MSSEGIASRPPHQSARPRRRVGGSLLSDASGSQEEFKPTYADKVQDRRAGLDTGRSFATGRGDREGSGGGYRELDRDAERRQKRRREEEAKETEERKKAKVRCKACKRFSCVC